MSTYSQPMGPVEYFFFDVIDHDKLSADLQRQGYVVETCEPGTVVVVGEGGHDDDMDRVAADHGATYDGHGQYVGPLDGLTGKG